MRTFTKILALALAIVMMFAMVGCSYIEDLFKPEDSENDTNTIAFAFPIHYKISTDKKSMQVGDTLKITVSLSREDIMDLDVELWIEEGDSYEVIGQREYSTANLEKNTEYVNINFEIKITKENYIAEKILFKFVHVVENTFNAIDQHKSCKFCIYTGAPDCGAQMLIGSGKGYVLYINGLGFVADSQGVIISRDFEQNKDNSPKNLEQIMTESLNREYAAGVSVQELMGRIIKFENCGKVFFEKFDSDKLAYSGKSSEYTSYLSEGMRVKIFFPDDKSKNENPEMFDRFFYLEKDDKAAEALLVLLERGMINYAEYDRELAYLRDNGIANRNQAPSSVVDYTGNGMTNTDGIVIVPGGSISGATNINGTITSPSTSDSIPGYTITITIHKEGTFIQESYSIDYSKLDFSVPKGDDFYHHILDLKNPV
jgi:hypothetical protein